MGSKKNSTDQYNHREHAPLASCATAERICSGGRNRGESGGGSYSRPAASATAAAVHPSLPISLRHFRLRAHWHAAAAQLTALLTICHVMRPSLVVFIVVGPILAIQWALRVGIHPNFALLARLLNVAVGGSTAPTLVAFGASKLAEHAVPLVSTPRRQPHKANRRAARSDGEYVSVPTKNGGYVMRDGRRFGAILRNERHSASVLLRRIA